MDFDARTLIALLALILSTLSLLFSWRTHRDTNVVKKAEKRTELLDIHNEIALIRSKCNDSIMRGFVKIKNTEQLRAYAKRLEKDEHWDDVLNAVEEVIEDKSEEWSVEKFETHISQAKKNLRHQKVYLKGLMEIESKLDKNES